MQCVSVTIYHLIDNALWGEVDGSFLQGQFSCGGIQCSVRSSDSASNLLETLQAKLKKDHSSRSSREGNSAETITVGLYNIHTWKTISLPPHKPSVCQLPVDLNVVESEESFGRFGHLFSMSFPHFDANSTTHPASTLPRLYAAPLNVSEFLPTKPFEELIPGAAFIASACHRRSVSNRLELVQRLNDVFRVDSLGKCKPTSGNQDISLGIGSTALESLRLKQRALNSYMFYLAFENTIEPGYVTEKVFDALVAGSVPVYLGATEDCRGLLPSSGAAVFVEDFGNDMSALGKLLLRLSQNKTEYELRRSWRTGFNPTLHLSPLMTKSWPCRICEWAVQNQERAKKRRAAATGPVKATGGRRRQEENCLQLS